MSFVGKLIGGTIGFALGGPLGAVAGAVLGSGFDRKENLHFNETVANQGVQQTSNMTFFLSAFSMLGKIAKVDGSITKEEIQVVEKFMDNHLKLDPLSREYAIKVFKEAAKSDEAFSEFAKQFYSHFKSEPQIIEIMLEMLLKISIADSNFSKEEENLVLQAVRIFNYGQDNYEALKSKFIKDTEKFYKILKCSKDDSFETIKQQYRKLVSEYHPDKIIAKGLPEEFVELANEKFKEIQNAFDEIKKEKRA